MNRKTCNQLPIKKFVNSVAANTAKNLFLGRRDGEQKKRFKEAYLAGLKGLTVTLEEDHPGLVRQFLDKSKVRGLLLRIIENRSIDESLSQIDELASELGLDPQSNDFRKLIEAVEAFKICFESQALEGADPLQWMIYFKIQAYFGEQISETPEVDLKKLENDYLTHLCDDFERIAFKGYTKGKTISIPLIEIFTKPQFDIENDSSREQALPDLEKEFRVSLETIQDNSINTLLQYRLAVVTGGPGAGKSTLLKYLALVLAAGQLKKEGPDILPIIFPISAYAEKKRKTQGLNYTIKTFLSDYWEERHLQDPIPLFEAYWQKGKALFLIDGLDEVADEGERQKMIEDVRFFIMAILKESQETNRFYVTCRSASYEGVTQFEQIKNYEFKRFKIKRFDIDQIGHFLLSWYCWYERDFKKRKDTYLKRAEDKRDNMIRVMNGNENIFDLATNPLMLTILALIEHEGGELPHSRAELYSECLRILSGAWENLRSLWKNQKVEYKLGNRPITYNMVVDFLGPVAFTMQDAAEKEIDEKELEKKLTISFGRRQKDLAMAKDEAQEFIRIMRERSGLLDLAKTKTFAFLHQTFREYLAAKWLAEFADYTQELGDRLLQAEWREVVLLMTASFPTKEASKFIDQLIKADTQRFIRLRLAGECILDMGRDRIFDATFNDLVTAIWNFIEERATAPTEKASLAEIIGRLGDSREDLEEFDPIEGGLYDLEKIGKVELTPFQIGKYLVTNQWFAKFVEDGGYESELLWTPQGKIWLQHTKARGSNLSTNPKYNCPNQPVTGISWYEATAFCNWMTKKQDGYSYFLPSEDQWQAAAVGKDNRKYPWGNEWKKDVCNTWESKIDRPSPVGIFNEGKTPNPHIFDMAGN
ncbi:MAG: SUMF1/EgtB/PvdO family nonheme iron enzyme [Desulfobacteraceae bacterium]|nr:SUMF1/EgtB/PvdO family nonheme iron enzyme [Desulfobacteraceae bacterium]